MLKNRHRLVWVYIQSALYVIAGCNHFIKPNVYLAIVPPALPDAEAVWYSGIAEILLGLLLLVPATRRMAGWGIIILLVIIFPANIYMAWQYMSTGRSNAWLTILRLPLQFVLIWLAWWSTKEYKLK